MLIVDDEKDILEVYEDTLRSTHQFRLIVKSRNGADALNKVSNQDFSLIIVDLKMPKIGGERFIELLYDIYKQKKKNAPPFLVISGNLTQKSVKNILNLGGKNFLAKPFTRDQLVDKINDLIK